MSANFVSSGKRLSSHVPGTCASAGQFVVQTDDMACKKCLLTADFVVSIIFYKVFCKYKHIYCLIPTLHCSDTLAEWSKALDLGSSPRGRGFKSHRCHQFLGCKQKMSLPCTRYPFFGKKRTQRTTLSCLCAQCHITHNNVQQCAITSCLKLPVGCYPLSPNPPAGSGASL